jgi:hypothetical protein
LKVAGVVGVCIIEEEAMGETPVIRISWQEHSMESSNIRRKVAWALVIGWGALGLGCDERPVILPANPPPAATSQAATRPTTQQLLTAKRKKLSLGTIESTNLSMEVPPSWQLNSGASSTWIEGETPHGDVRIQVAMQGAPLKEAAVTAMEQRARAQATSQPTTLEVVPMRNIGGGAKKMERREFLRGLEIPRGNNEVEKVDRVDWTAYLFVPQVNGYQVVTLNFSGLSIQQDKEDREFLDHILRSIRYDAAGGALD